MLRAKARATPTSSEATAFEFLNHSEAAADSSS